MAAQSHYLVLIADVRHIGDIDPRIEGIMFEGAGIEANFELPAELDSAAYAIVQCRTLHNQRPNKRFLINNHRVHNFLDPHPQNSREWFFESAVLPGNCLRAGTNNFQIEFEDEEYDNFMLTDLVIWYQTRE